MKARGKRTLKERRRIRKRRRLIRNWIIALFLVSILGVGCFKIITREKQISEVINDEEQVNEETITEEKTNEESAKKESVKEEVVISAAGDCTLGTDSKFPYAGSFLEEIKNSGYDYGAIMRNVSEVFKNDDYTIINLESPFTDSEVKSNKGTGEQYHFKGPKEYTKILTEGYIEGVTLSNNHIYDYGTQGFTDTVNALGENNIDYCGEGYKIVKEIKGIKFGFLGYNGWSASEELKNKIKSDIDELRQNDVKVIIPYFHWGKEKSYSPSPEQTELGRFAIDSGADLVLGSHSHVMQTVENYNGKLIIYSLGNFSFGGNSNPKDKRSFIFQGKFKFEDCVLNDVEFKFIPITISSVTSRNDYRPTIANDSVSGEVINALNELSPTMKGQITNEFFSMNTKKYE